VTSSGPASAGLGQSNLGLSSRQLGSAVLVIDITGELDIATAVQLQAYLVEKTAARPGHVVLGLRGVTFLASCGLGVLVAAHRGGGDIHGKLHLTGAMSNRVVKRVLDVTGLTAVFDIHENEDKLLSELMPHGEV
jgi:anti-sigma B factor antagonist